MVHLHGANVPAIGSASFRFRHNLRVCDSEMDKYWDGIPGYFFESVDQSLVSNSDYSL